MHILCLGISHNTASLALRECLAYTEEAIETALARLVEAGPALAGLSELAILSTCNRVELYAAVPQPDFAPLEAFLLKRHGPGSASFRDELQSHMYRLVDEAAAEHLLRVAAGLDSLVLGEPQILGQVTHALELALRQGAAGPLLSRLFQSAIHAGKRVRSETAIAQNPASIPSLAVRLALEVFPHLDRVRVAVLGAGDMAEALVESLHKRGAGHITVVNRTLERARLLARRWEAAATTFQDLEAVLADADLLIASTGAPHTLISAQQVSVLMQARPGRPLLVIDIAVPRDVEAAVAQVPGAQMYDLDALQSYLEQHLAVRQGEVPEAEAILEAELAGFMEFLEAQEVLSVIKTMRQQAEAIRQAELEKTFRHLPDLTPAERQRIEALTAALIGKLLHTPTARLRAEAQRSRAGEFTSVARSLFGIEPPARDYDAR